jgi:DNA replication protein DnaC
MLENAVDVPSELYSVDLLVISDIEPNSRKPATDFEERAITELVDRRYGQMLPTVVTTNKESRSDLVRSIGERAVDRLWEGAVKVPMFWPSYRKR